MRKFSDLLSEKIDALGQHQTESSDKKISWLEKRAAEACLEKLRALEARYRDEIKNIPPSTAQEPILSNGDEQDKGEEESLVSQQNNNAAQKSNFIKSCIEHEYQMAFDKALKELATTYSKQKELGALLENPQSPQSYEDFFTTLAENSKGVADLAQMARDLHDIKASARHPNQIASIEGAHLPKLRDRMFLAFQATNKKERAQALYDFYYVDLFDLRNEIEKNPAHWKGWGEKTHLVLKTIEAQLKERSKTLPPLAELFYKETFESIQAGIGKILGKYLGKKIPKLNQQRETRHASVNNGATGEMAPISIHQTADKILAHLRDIGESSGSYETKIEKWYDAMLSIREKILLDHTTGYRDAHNSPLQEQNALLTVLNRLQPSSKAQEKQSKATEISEENATQKCFQARFKPTELAQNVKLTSALLQTIDKGVKNTAPDSIRKTTQSGHHTLLKIDALCLNYYRKRSDSHWFRTIEDARKGALKENKAGSLFERVEKAHLAFLRAKEFLLDETFAQNEGRSKLFNSRSLALINEVIQFTRAEIEKLKPEGWTSQEIEALTSKVARKETTVNEKYNHSFFGCKRLRSIRFETPSFLRNKI